MTADGFGVWKGKFAVPNYLLRALAYESDDEITRYVLDSVRRGASEDEVGDGVLKILASVAYRDVNWVRQNLPRDSPDYLLAIRGYETFCNNDNLSAIVDAIDFDGIRRELGIIGSKSIRSPTVRRHSSKTRGVPKSKGGRR